MAERSEAEIEHIARLIADEKIKALEAEITRLRRVIGAFIADEPDPNR